MCGFNLPNPPIRDPAPLAWQRVACQRARAALCRSLHDNSDGALNVCEEMPGPWDVSPCLGPVRAAARPRLHHKVNNVNTCGRIRVGCAHLRLDCQHQPAAPAYLSTNHRPLDAYRLNVRLHVDAEVWCVVGLEMGRPESAYPNSHARSHHPKARCHCSGCPWQVVYTKWLKRCWAPLVGFGGRSCVVDLSLSPTTSRR